MKIFYGNIAWGSGEKILPRRLLYKFCQDFFLPNLYVNIIQRPCQDIFLRYFVQRSCNKTASIQRSAQRSFKRFLTNIWLTKLLYRSCTKILPGALLYILYEDLVQRARVLPGHSFFHSFHGHLSFGSLQIFFLVEISFTHLLHIVYVRILHHSFYREFFT